MIANEVIGWIGSILFAICALPQVIHTYRTRKTDDLNELFLWLWFLGEVFTFAYILYGDFIEKTNHIPLYFNYFFNIIMVSYLLYAKYHYTKQATSLRKLAVVTRSWNNKLKDKKKLA